MSSKFINALLADLKILRQVHGNLPVVARHIASADFGVADNLEICRVFYDEKEDVFVLLVES